MFTVRVMPISRGVFKESLTYFSKESFPVGSVVSISVRGRRVPGIVTEVGDARDEKLGLRASGYALKKLPTGTKARRIFSEAFIEAAKETADWHGVHASAVITLLSSREILESAAKITEAPAFASAKETMEARADFLVFQADREERVRTYRNLAREAFARGSSILILTPTVKEAETLVEELKRGIAEHVVLLTGEIAKKKLIAEWNRAVESPAPVLIVGTAFSLSLPRHDIDTILVERESARSYRTVSRPHLDIRRAARACSKKSGARVIFADFPLRVESRYLVDASRAEELARSQLRPSSTATVTVLDERKNESMKGERRVFQVLEAETKRSIESQVKKGGHVVIFAARRGIAPLTVCNDCGTPVTDPTSGVPMVLHKTENGNVFISHRSGAIMPGNITCKTCGGWNLVTLGIGIDRVTAEVEKTFPYAKLFVITKDSAPTHARAEKLAHDFYASEGAILIGTERMLPYLSRPVELAVVASIDSILSLPEWRADEHALSILFYLGDRAEHALIVETRKPESEVMKALQAGNPTDFYRLHIEERERYSYPPFSVFVGLIAHGTEALVNKLGEIIKETFGEYDLVGPLPAEATTKTKWVSRAVVRVPPELWPHETIVGKLKELPSSIEVVVDPDEIV